MGVLIRGMEIPKNCWECSLSDVDDDYGRCCLFSGIACLNIGRQDNCPLVEVPTPHGRLIDANALTKDLKECMCAANNNWEYEMVTGYSNAIESVEEADTIIEAEGGL